MTKMDDYARGRQDGIRWAITWLHARGETMNAPKAKAILDCAADHMGKETSKRVRRLNISVRATPDNPWK